MAALFVANGVPANGVQMDRAWRTHVVASMGLSSIMPSVVVCAEDPDLPWFGR